MIKFDQLPPGAIITCNSDFTLKTLFTKPLRYVIQLFAGQPEHVFLSLGSGLFFEATGEGTHIIEASDWVKSHKTPEMLVAAYCLTYPLDPEDQQKLFDICKGMVGRPYSAALAAYSAFDKIWPFSKLKIESKNREFCSSVCWECLESLGTLPKKEGFKINPKELVNYCNKNDITTGKQLIDFS